MTATQLVSTGLSSSGTDVSARKIYVGNVPYEISSERLLEFFSVFGDIEEGPLGFDKSTGKTKGFAFFIYKTEEAARTAIIEPTKVIDGHQVMYKMATDNKKVKAPGPVGAVGENVQSQPLQFPHQSIPGSQYGMPGNMPGYGLNSSVPNSVIAGGYGVRYGEFGGLNNAGNSMYRMQKSVGMPSGGYPEATTHGMSQQPQSLPPRVPPGGMHPGMPPYY